MTHYQHDEQTNLVTPVNKRRFQPCSALTFSYLVTCTVNAQYNLRSQGSFFINFKSKWSNCLP